MSYENPRQPEHINVSTEHPLKEFFQLLFGVIALVVVAVFLLAGTAQLLAPYIPFEVEQQLADTVDTTLFLDAGAQIADDDPRQAYVLSLVERLASAMDLPGDMTVNVDVVQGNTVNAYATLGGQIVIYTGLLERMPHENALAMVLAHEIAHVKLRHPIVALGRGLTVTVALSSIFGLTDNAAVVRLVEWVGITSTLSFSRDQERSADELAAAAMIEVYGHLQGASEIFKVLGGEDEAGANGGPAQTLDFLNTHPGLAERIETIEAQAAALGARGVVQPLPWEVDRT